MNSKRSNARFELIKRQKALAMKRITLIFAYWLLFMTSGCGSNKDSEAESFFALDETISWISSAATADGSLNIVKTSSDGINSEVTNLTNSTQNDYKPVISPDGQHIAFFRAFSEGNNFFLWNTAIYVMDIDGSNLRALTDSQFMNTEPYWARDGSKRITWNRMIHFTEGRYGTYVYETDLDAQPGDERQLSTGRWEWGNSHIMDGRIFVSRNESFHLMIPYASDSGYQQINYPDTYHYLHKLSISNDESKIAYMKKIQPNGDDYRGSQIILADFDASIPSISNEKVIVPKDESKFSWYVSISADNDYVIYAEDGKIMLHRVDDGMFGQVSTRNDLEYRYPTFVGTSK